LISVDLNEPFPEIPDNIDIVFDLAGSISNDAKSINSALRQSDIVLVPIYNEIKSIKAGLSTIAECLPINSHIAVIATKLQKRGYRDVFSDRVQSQDMVNIRNAVHGSF
jgi:hypothetical protein